MVERYIRKAELYYESNPKVKILLGAVKSEMKTAERKAATDNAIDNAKRIAAGMLENKYVRWVIGVILLVILIHYLFQYLYQEWWWFF